MHVRSHQVDLLDQQPVRRVREERRDVRGDLVGRPFDLVDDAVHEMFAFALVASVKISAATPSRTRIGPSGKGAR